MMTENATPVKERKARLPEMRIFHFEIPEKPSPEELKSEISTIADAGFNALCIFTFMNGYSIFPSGVCRESHLPQIRPDLKKKRGLFQELLDTAKSRNLRVYACADPLLVGKEPEISLGPILKKKRKWGAMNRLKRFFPVGKYENRLFLCLSNVDVRRFAADIIVEIAESYPVDGMILDVHNHPFSTHLGDSAACFCEYCRKRVKDDLQLDLMTIPLNPEDAAFRRWKRWKDERLYSFVHYVSGRLRETRMGMPFFATVKGNLRKNTEQEEGKNILPSGWAAGGVVTSLFTCYDHESPELIPGAIKKDLSRIVDDTLMAPALEAQTSSQLADYVLHYRKLPVAGGLLSLEDIPDESTENQLRQAPFDKDSPDIFEDIYQSAQMLSKNIMNSSDIHPALYGFLKDVVSYLENREEITLDGAQSLVEDFRTIEAKFQSGDLDAAFLPEEALRHIALIKKILRTAEYLTG